MHRGLVAGLVLLTLGACGCSSIPPDPLQIDRGLLTVDNRTSTDWHDVEIWVNHYFRATVPSIAAGSRLQVPLDAFVSGYARRFDRQHMMVNDLRLIAKDPQGAPVEVVKQFERSGLAALGAKRKS